MSDKPTTLRELISNELPRLYAFAYHMSGNRRDARGHMDQLVREAKPRAEALLSDDDPSNAVLGLMARTMEENLGRKSDYSFEGLDNLLRSDITRPIDLSGGALQGSPQKVHVMLWELKRSCLTATLCCLPPGVRVSFVLTDLMGFAPAEASNLLGIKESAYRVRLTRARKRIEDYLTPRCAHVDPQNPCTCTGRLIIALDGDFIKTPAHTLDIPHEPHDSAGPRRDMGSLYRSLPQAQLTPDEQSTLLADTDG